MGSKKKFSSQNGFFKSANSVFAVKYDEMHLQQIARKAKVLSLQKSSLESLDPFLNYFLINDFKQSLKVLPSWSYFNNNIDAILIHL